MSGYLERQIIRKSDVMEEIEMNRKDSFSEQSITRMQYRKYHYCDRRWNRRWILAGRVHDYRGDRKKIFISVTVRMMKLYEVM